MYGRVFSDTDDAFMDGGAEFQLFGAGIDFPGKQFLEYRGFRGDHVEFDGHANDFNVHMVDPVPQGVERPGVSVGFGDVSLAENHAHERGKRDRTGVQHAMSRMTPDQVKEFSHESLFFLSTMLLGYKDWDVVHDDLERFLMRPSARKAILLPRGHMKSTIVTVAYVVFRILRNPNIRVLVANQVWDMSRKFLREIKGQLEMSPLRALYGEFVSPKWNEDEIVVRQRSKSLKEPTVLTTGSEAEITGGHFDLIVLDDLTGLQNSQTPEQREKTKRFRRSMFNLLEPGSELIEIGTRWHLDDTFSVVLSAEREFYDVMVRQVVENGKIIFPKKFNLRFDPSRKSWAYVESPSMDYIDYLKKSMPLSEFNAQYMNNPIDSENAIFRASYFRYFDRRPDGLYVSMKVDPAISQKQEADYTAITVTGMDKNRDIYLLDYAQGHWSPSEIINQIFLKHGQWKPQDTGLESVGFQRTLKWALEEEMRRRGRHFGVTEVKTGTMVSKESRIKALEPYYREGKIYHSHWMKGKELETQLLTFPKSVHDDLCFVAGTRIATPFGDRDIEKIKKGDFVLTPFGVRRVLSAGLTGERDVVSHDGIVGTPNHPVFTYKNGFMSIDTLTMHDEKSKISLKEVLLWKYRKLLFSMENPIALWGRGAITSVSQQRIAEGKVRKDFMLRFGSFIRERKFVKAITFITKTGILLITTLAIWNAYRLGNTIESLKKSISN